MPPPATEVVATAPVAVRDEPLEHWQSRSMDEVATITQLQSATTCHSRCSARDLDVWTSDACIGTKGDYVFVTNDCSSIILIVAEPEMKQRWENTTVIATFTRATVARTYPGGPMLAAKNVKSSDGHFHWLDGAPRYLHGGAGVELKLIGGRTTRLPFREGESINEETILNDKPTVSTPTPPVDPYPTAYRQMGPVPPAPPVARREEKPKPPERDPNAGILSQICSAPGVCFDQYLQPPPTIKAPPGEPLYCRNEHEACGNNQDCCGGNCKNGSCQ